MIVDFEGKTRLEGIGDIVIKNSPNNDEENIIMLLYAAVNKYAEVNEVHPIEAERSLMMSMHNHIKSFMKIGGWM